MDLHDLRDLPFGNLVHRLTEQFSRLIRQEFTMIREDLTASARRAAKAAIFMAAAASLGLLAVVALTFAAVAGLATVVPLWAAGLIVAAAYAVIASICAVVGMNAVRRISKSRNPIASLEEDLRWVKMRAKSAKP